MVSKLLLFLHLPIYGAIYCCGGVGRTGDRLSIPLRRSLV